MKNWFEKYGVDIKDIRSKYDNPVAQAYREKLKAAVDGKPYVDPSPSDFKNMSFNTRVENKKPVSQTSTGYNSSNMSSRYQNKPSSISSPGFSYEPSRSGNSEHGESDMVELISNGWSKFTDGVRNIAEKLKDSTISEEIDDLGRRIKDTQGWETVTSFFTSITGKDYDEPRSSYYETSQPTYNDRYRENSSTINTTTCVQPKETAKSHFDDWDNDTFESFDKKNQTSENTITVTQSSKNHAKTDSFEVEKSKSWDDWDDWD